MFDALWSLLNKRHPSLELREINTLWYHFKMIDSIGLLLIFVTISLGLLKVWQKKLSHFFEADTFSFLIQFISVICIIPVFYFIDFKFVLSIKNILLVIGAGASWYIGTLITNRSIKATDLTLREPIIQTRLVFVLLISFFFLKENINTYELIGAIIVFLGAVISSYHPSTNLKKLSKEGVFICLLASFLIAISYSFDKYALNFIEVVSWAFFMYLIPLIFLMPKIGSAVTDIKKQKINNLVSMFVLVFLSSLA